MCVLPACLSRSLHPQPSHLTLGASELDRAKAKITEWYHQQMSTKKRDVVQVKNPRTNRYVKIDRSAGKIIAHKKSPGRYKDVPVARKRK